MTKKGSMAPRAAMAAALLMVNQIPAGASTDLDVELDSGLKMTDSAINQINTRANVEHQKLAQWNGEQWSGEEGFQEATWTGE